MQQYRGFILDVRNFDEPKVITFFIGLGDGEGKYREGWQDVTALTNGKPTPHNAVKAVFADAALKAPITLPHGDAIKLVMLVAVKAPKAKTVSQEAVQAILANAKLDDAAKVAAIAALQA